MDWKPKVRERLSHLLHLTPTIKISSYVYYAHEWNAQKVTPQPLNYFSRSSTFACGLNRQNHGSTRKGIDTVHLWQQTQIHNHVNHARHNLNRHWIQREVVENACKNGQSNWSKISNWLRNSRSVFLHQHWTLCSPVSASGSQTTFTWFCFKIPSWVFIAAVAL